MIDSVKLSLSINLSPKLFFPWRWKRLKTKDGQPYFFRDIRGVKLYYYERTHMFFINGKILMLLHDAHVQNIDDIYGSRTDLFLDELNKALDKLFPYPVFDIRDFKVTKIDYCFNVQTPHVDTYLSFLKKAFRMTSSGKVNFTEENNLSGSVYIKTQADYKANTNKNYTLNFYNKTDRLHFLQKKGQPVSEADFALAKNILRLEVQCGHQLIKNQTNKFGINNTFGDLLSYPIAYDTIATVYARSFKGTASEDFFTYTAAKSKLKGKPAALKAIFVAASHSITDQKYYRGRSQAKKVGIYPYCFLEKSSSITFLENPLKLLQEKMSTYEAYPL